MASYTQGDTANAVPYGTMIALHIAVTVQWVFPIDPGKAPTGVLVGALLYSNFAPVQTLDAIINDGLITAIADNAGIFLFLVILGTIVALVNAAGGSAAFGRWAEKNM